MTDDVMTVTSVVVSHLQVIVKSGDDCRQEHFAVQLLAHFWGEWGLGHGMGNRMRLVYWLKHFW